MKYISHSEEDTVKLAKKVAKNLKGGEILGLIGDLGAGKTAFTKGLAAALGIKKNITSPTFVIMKAYKIPASNQLPASKLIHIDAYRLKTAEDLVAIGALEYLGKPDTISIIEWADRIRKILPRETKYIRIKLNKEGLRNFNYKKI